ncbi:hypothetical protein BDV12DRAFT_196849 [Aspergillus spectabilis]
MSGNFTFPTEAENRFIVADLVNVTWDVVAPVVSLYESCEQVMNSYSYVWTATRKGYVESGCNFMLQPFTADRESYGNNITSSLFGVSKRYTSDPSPVSYNFVNITSSTTASSTSLATVGTSESTQPTTPTSTSEISHGLSNTKTWVALNWKITLPTPETHPNFPLWERGYTPEQVYDLFFPPNFRFLCNPKRPAVCGRFGLPGDRLWRFEFVVQQGECAERMASQEALQSVVFPYITHPKNRYGLSQDITFPADCIQTLRSRPFVFSARSCNKWALGRTILCGDSAHVFPPFGGQGITSGFRDATSLAWRLAILTQKQLPKQSLDHNRILLAWYRERKQQLERSLAATVENGSLVTEGNPIKVFLRNAMFAIFQLLPSWRRWCEKGARRDGMVSYSYEAGFHFLPAFGGGKLIPQVYCVGFLSGKKDTVVFSDDVIFAGCKRGLFQVLILANDLGEVRDLRGGLAQGEKVTTWSAGYALSSEVTFLLHDLTLNLDAGPISGSHCMDVVRVASAEEFAKSPLCEGRPPPLYYDEFRLQKEVDGRKFVVIRPDRFIFGACETINELQGILGEIQGVLD